ncbi:TPA: Lymphocyte transmembrane adapter 1 [Trebouxia sp. C0005]
MASGVFFQLVFATLALWTLFLLATLYQELKKRKAAWRRDLHHGIIMVTLDELHMSGWTDKVYCVQYHEVVFELCGPWLGSASWLVNVLALVGLAVAQVIACANNMYRLSSFRNKRDYALLFGSVGLTTSFIPSFRNMRIFSFIAILGTTFTAWYMVAQASAQGLQEGLWGQAPTQGLQAFVEGSTNLLFVYGGHAMLMEVMDSMHQPRKFPRVFTASYLYVFTLTLPSAATMFAAFPVLSAQNGNVYDLLPESPVRSVSIVLMIIHQCIAFGMFIMPVHHMWEKLIRTHDKPYWIRLPSRLPVGILVILISLAFPFFGVINSFLGAGTTTLETYIIPALAYNWVYRRESAQIACPAPPPW